MFSPRRRLGGTLAVVAAGLLVGAQFVPVDRANPPVRHDVGAPPAVAALLRAACYDCHSRETRWPWYSRVAPVSWLVARDVRLGRRELNFSEWPAFDFEEQDDLMAHIAKQVERGRMPLPIYLTMHAGAKLSAADRRTLVAWAKGE